MKPREKALELFNQYFYSIPSLFNEGKKEYILVWMDSVCYSP